LVLILFITTSLIYSVRVRPRIQAQYVNLVTSNIASIGEIGRLHDLGLLSSELSQSEPNKRIASNSESSSLLEKMKLLLQSHLCLRRLMVWNPDDSSFRLQAAIVSDLQSEYAYQQAKAFESDGDTRPKIEERLNQAAMYQRQALDEMQRVALSNEKWSTVATLWLAKKRMENHFEISAKELVSLEQSIRKGGKNLSTAISPEQVLGQLLIARALKADSELTSDQRRELLQEAKRLMHDTAESDLSAMSWKALADSGIEPLVAKELAWKTAQLYWSSPLVNTPSPTSIAAVFNCLIIGDSFREAQNLIGDRISKLTHTEQSTLRKLTAIACIQSAIATSLLSEHSATGNGNRVASCLTLAILLDPESSELASFLKPALTGSHAPWAASILENQKSDNPSVNHLVAVAQSIFQNQIVPDCKKLIESVNTMPAFGMAASKLLVRLVNDSPESIESVERVIQVLRSINESRPELLSVWTDRAGLHVKIKQYDQAIECLKYVQNQLPNSEDIRASIDHVMKLRSEIAQAR
ncbi:MAG: hypothetical protein ABL921_23145, partial [Pirellula sp.]